MIKVNHVVRYAMLGSFQPLTSDNTSDALAQSSTQIQSDDPSVVVDSQISQDDSGNLTSSIGALPSQSGLPVYIDVSIVKPASSVACTQIFITNNSSVTTKWSLMNLAGDILYTTDESYVPASICLINLPDIHQIDPDSIFKLKAIVTDGRDSISDVSLQYEPNTINIANFELKGTSLKTIINYLP